jgi:hypothetical protein
MKHRIATYEMTEFPSYEELKKAREEAESNGDEVYSSVNHSREIFFLKVRIKAPRGEI